MDIKIQRLFFVVGLFIFCCSGVFAQNNGSTRLIKGRVLDSSTKEAIPYAGVYMPDVEKGTIADADGLFSISVMYKDDELKIRFSSLGYVTQDVMVKKNKEQLEILLSPQSIELKEFSVSAKYSENLGSDAEIGQEALEYIQPTSLRDVFLLLQGERLIYLTI